jgi:hypothetical protein
MTTVVGFLCVAVTTACDASVDVGPSDRPLSATAPTGADLGVLASVRGTGGLCADGVCVDELVVYDSGHWRRTRQQDVVDGRLENTELVRLRQAIGNFDVAALRSAPAPTSCAADADGLEMTYTAGAGPTAQSISSCAYELPSADALIALLNAFFNQLG